VQQQVVAPHDKLMATIRSNSQGEVKKEHKVDMKRMFSFEPPQDQFILPTTEAEVVEVGYLIYFLNLHL
jgi:hypothetical protein